MAASQDHGRSWGHGAEGAPDGRAWGGGGVGALLSQDSPSGLPRDDPSANRPFGRVWFRKATSISLEQYLFTKSAHLEQLWMTPRIQMLEGRPSPASYSRDQGSDFCKKQSTHQWLPVSEGSESVRRASPLLRREPPRASSEEAPARTTETQHCLRPAGHTVRPCREPGRGHTGVSQCD